MNKTCHLLSSNLPRLLVDSPKRKVSQRHLRRFSLKGSHFGIQFRRLTKLELMRNVKNRSKEPGVAPKQHQEFYMSDVYPSGANCFLCTHRQTHLVCTACALGWAVMCRNMATRPPPID